MRPRTAAVYAEAIDFFRRALALNPQSAEAHACLASALVGRVLGGITETTATDLDHAEQLIDQALAASPRFALAHLVKGHVLRAPGRYEEGVPEYEAALALDRNLVNALDGLAWSKLYAGAIEEMVPLVEKAVRLSPRD